MRLANQISPPFQTTTVFRLLYVEPFANCFGDQSSHWRQNFATDVTNWLRVVAHCIY